MSPQKVITFADAVSEIFGLTGVIEAEVQYFNMPDTKGWLLYTRGGPKEIEFFLAANSVVSLREGNKKECTQLLTIARPRKPMEWYVGLYATRLPAMDNDHLTTMSMNPTKDGEDAAARTRLRNYARRVKAWLKRSELAG